jgi:hypothetical protein
VKRHHLILLLITMFTWSLGGAHAQTARAQHSKDACFTISLATPPDRQNVGGPVDIQATVKNTSGKEIYWSYAKTDTVYQAFRVQLERDGKQVETTTFHRRILGQQRVGDSQVVEDGDSIALPVAAQATMTWTLDLSKLYQITEPGTYLVSASRDDECSKARVQSNRLSFQVSPAP